MVDATASTSQASTSKTFSQSQPISAKIKGLASYSQQPEQSDNEGSIEESSISDSRLSHSTGIKPRNTANVRVNRASKNNAILAMTSQEPSEKAPRKNPAKKKGIVSSRLDFSTIKTSAPRNIHGPPERPASQPTRMFGLEHAPVYHPSIEEFAQPMEYIEKIAIEAKEYGICKIVPPVGWRPPFALNTEVRLLFSSLFDLTNFLNRLFDSKLDFKYLIRWKLLLELV